LNAISLRLIIDESYVISVEYINVFSFLVCFIHRYTETSSNGQDNVEESHGLRKELGSAESYDDKLKGKGKIHESDPFLPHLSQLDPDVLASLPPEILSEISDVYNIKVVDYFLGNHPVSDRYNIANNNAMEKFSAHTCSKRQEISFPILEGCSSKAVRSDSKNIECDNRHKILKREEEEQRQDSAAKTVWSVDLPASLEVCSFFLVVHGLLFYSLFVNVFLMDKCSVKRLVFF
jgi:hypothetical protein